MTLLSIPLALVLLALALLHILWGIGFWFPIREESALVRAAIGLKGVTRMPGPIPCSVVAVALIWAAAMPFVPPGWFRDAGLWIAFAVFLVRGLLPYGRRWRRIAPQEPFATYDRRYYGPLSLLIAAGYFAIVVSGF